MSDDSGAGAPVPLLWAGGWDSTFRLLQLLLIQRSAVQPVYVVSTERRITMRELRAMRQIREVVLARLSDPALLSPTTAPVAEDVAPRPDLVELRWAIRRPGVKVGTQYVLLAAVADEQGWAGVELYMDAHDEGPTDLHRVVFTDGRGTMSDPGGAALPGLHLPVLHVTRGEMAAIATEQAPWTSWRCGGTVTTRWPVARAGRATRVRWPIRLAPVRAPGPVALPVSTAAHGAQARAAEVVAAPAGARRPSRRTAVAVVDRSLHRAAGDRGRRTRQRTLRGTLLRWGAGPRRPRTGRG